MTLIGKDQIELIVEGTHTHTRMHAYTCVFVFYLNLRESKEPKFTNQLSEISYQNI